MRGFFHFFVVLLSLWLMSLKWITHAKRAGVTEKVTIRKHKLIMTEVQISSINFSLLIKTLFLFQFTNAHGWSWWTWERRKGCFLRLYWLVLLENYGIKKTKDEYQCFYLRLSSKPSKTNTTNSPWKLRFTRCASLQNTITRIKKNCNFMFQANAFLQAIP